MEPLNGKKNSTRNLQVVISGNVIAQFVSILKLLVAQVTGKFLLLVPTVDPLVPSQAVLPFVSFPTMQAHVSWFERSHATVRFVTLVQTVLRPRRVPDLRDIPFVTEQRENVPVFADPTSLSLHHPYRPVFSRFFGTCGKNVQCQRSRSTRNATTR